MHVGGSLLGKPCSRGTCRLPISNVIGRLVPPGGLSTSPTESTTQALQYAQHSGRGRRLSPRRDDASITLCTLEFRRDGISTLL